MLSSLANAPRFLTIVLWADAFSSAACALLHLLAGGAIAPMLGLPAALMAVGGVVLVVAVALAAYLASCDPVPRAGLALLVAANVAWVVACVATFAMHAGSLTPLGEAYLIVNAVAVAILAEFEWMGLRRVQRASFA